MAISRISGNQISTSTAAIISTLSFLSTNSVFRLPTGTTAQRPTGVSAGTLRFNSSIDNAEIYVTDDGTGSAGWTAVAGGGPSLGTDSIIRTNAATIAENLTVKCPSKYITEQEKNEFSPPYQEENSKNQI